MTLQQNVLCNQFVCSSKGDITRRPAIKREIVRFNPENSLKVISKIISPGMINTNGDPQTLMKQFFKTRFSIVLFLGSEISFHRQHTII